MTAAIVGAVRSPSVQEHAPRRGVKYFAVEKATGKIISVVEADANPHPHVTKRLASREVVLVEVNAEMRREIEMKSRGPVHQLTLDLSINRLR